MSYRDLQFTDAENALIAGAWHSGVFDWNGAELKGLRSRIRAFYRSVLKDECCYCRKQFLDDHPLAVDIEHVLPKSKFHSFAISAVNLTVACKRCNMTIKRDRLDFLHGFTIDQVMEAAESSQTYEIIHPNLDDYYEHVSIRSVAIDAFTLRRYLIVSDSEKGRRTVEFFDLRDLERDELDAIQGIEGQSGSLRAKRIRKLLGL